MTVLRHALCGDDFHQTPVSIIFSEKRSKFFFLVLWAMQHRCNWPGRRNYATRPVPYIQKSHNYIGKPCIFSGGQLRWLPHSDFELVLWTCDLLRQTFNDVFCSCVVDVSTFPHPWYRSRRVGRSPLLMRCSIAIQPCRGATPRTKNNAT